MNRFLKLTAAIFLTVVVQVEGQSFSQLRPHAATNFLNLQANSSAGFPDTTYASTKFPDPHEVLYKSLIIPGWGQVVNHQIWKVPIVYALLGGLTAYSIYLTKQYHNYRAAYYNLNGENKDDDQRFGATPPYLQGVNSSSLKSSRNSLHNRRDFIYVTIALAYGLNAIDAYVFAHLRSFDVSNDLSVRTSLKPRILAYSTPGVTLSFNLFNKSK